MGFEYRINSFDFSTIIADVRCSLLWDYYAYVTQCLIACALNLRILINLKLNNMASTTLIQSRLWIRFIAESIAKLNFCFFFSSILRSLDFNEYLISLTWRLWMRTIWRNYLHGSLRCCGTARKKKNNDNVIRFLTKCHDSVLRRLQKKKKITS